MTHAENVDAKYKRRMQIAFKVQRVVTVNPSPKHKEKYNTVLLLESSILCIIELSEWIQSFRLKKKGSHTHKKYCINKTYRMNLALQRNILSFQDVLHHLSAVLWKLFVITRR